MEQFKDRLKELREEAGISMQQLANIIGVSNAAICKWENGIAEPKVSYLIKLASYFNCTIDFLAGTTNDFNAAANDAEKVIKLSISEKKIINSYRKLSPCLRDLLQDTIEVWEKNDKI